MKLLPWLGLYILTGVVVFWAVSTLSEQKWRLLDRVLLSVLWPLMLHFAVSRSGSKTDGHDEHDALCALRRAGGAPLAPLLPDVAEGRRLTERLAKARHQLAEIDALLAQDEFSIAKAEQRLHTLQEAGDVRSAARVLDRVSSLKQILAMQTRYLREVQEIEELLMQLRLHAELVRLSGYDNGTQELLEELEHRMRGLDSLLEEG